MRARSAARSTNWCSPGPGSKIDKVAGIEARGFILGGAVAHQVSAGFVPIRKKGKLPHTTVRIAYSLEYGLDEMEMHVDAIKPGERVILVDDLIATGGTAEGAVKLLRQIGADVVAACFIIDLPDLGGAGKAARDGRAGAHADDVRGALRPSQHNALAFGFAGEASEHDVGVLQSSLPLQNQVQLQLAKAEVILADPLMQFGR